MRSSEARSRGVGRLWSLGLWSLGLCTLVALGVALVIGLQQGGGVGAQEPTKGRGLLPRFEGPRLEGGGRISTDVFRDRRGLLFVFSPRDPDASTTAAVVARLAGDAAAANVALLGVTRDLDPGRTRRFAERHELDLPLIVDTDGRIAAKLQVPRGTPAVFLIDGEGYILGGFIGFPPGVEDVEAAYESYLRELLRLQKAESLVAPALGVLPEAPAFRVTSTEGTPLELSNLRGKVVVLVFFLPTCPHCHEALRFLDGLHERLANPDLAIVPVSVQDRPGPIASMVADHDLELAMYVDPDRDAQRAYEHHLSVPDTLVIDRQGRVAARHRGAGARLEALITMEVRQALGVENPLLLSRDSYSGEEACRVCHGQQHASWSITNHAYAFETLAEHGEDRNPECLGCHVVGWEQAGGYSVETPYAHLEGVQCENCHGRGGPHQSPDFADVGLEAVCAECHTSKHSLHFVFAERLPLVSHAANLRFADLSIQERQALLERRDKRERTLFARADYVGSAACQSCHAAEHSIWAAGPHGAAFETLEAKNQSENRDCVVCHVTGFEQPGGYPEGGAAVSNVGCESCHGPGGDHVGAEQKRKGTILALADKCDSCVILQICGSCHTDEWDPNFEFELGQKLETIRHGMASTAAVAP